MTDKKKKVETYHTYGGDATVVAFNKKILGEVQGIDYDGSKKQLEVEFANFIKPVDGDPEPINYAWLKNERNMLVEQLSVAYCGEDPYFDPETGGINYKNQTIAGKRYRRIVNVNFLYEKSGISIDTPYEKTIYVFSYDEISPAYDVNLSVTTENMTEYMNQFIK